MFVFWSDGAPEEPEDLETTLGVKRPELGNKPNWPNSPIDWDEDPKRPVWGKSPITPVPGFLAGACTSLEDWEAGLEVVDTDTEGAAVGLEDVVVGVEDIETGPEGREAGL